MALILEVTHADGSRTRHWLNGQTLTIGRSLRNDVILDDPYVDANHARVTLDDGHATVEDLGSVNGLMAGAQRLVGPSTVRPGDAVRLGRTVIHFRDPNEAVAPALVDGQPATPVAIERRERRLRFPTTTWARLGIVLVTLIAVGVSAWLDDTTRSAANEVVSVTLGVASFLALWAGLWSIASRIIVHQFRFLGHLAVAASFALAAMIWELIESWLLFLFPNPGILSAVGYVIAALLIAALVAGHLSLASVLTRRLQWRVGAIAAATVMGITLLSVLTKADSFSDVPKYPATVKPIAANLVPTETIDQFEASTRKIKDDVDQLAKK